MQKHLFSTMSIIKFFVAFTVFACKCFKAPFFQEYKTIKLRLYFICNKIAIILCSEQERERYCWDWLYLVFYRKCMIIISRLAIFALYIIYTYFTHNYRFLYIFNTIIYLLFHFNVCITIYYNYYIVTLKIYLAYEDLSFDYNSGT